MTLNNSKGRGAERTNSTATNKDKYFHKLIFKIFGSFGLSFHEEKALFEK